MAGYMGFAALRSRVAKDGARNPGAVAAAAGRKKYGAERMSQASAFGRKHPNRKALLAPR